MSYSEEIKARLEARRDELERRLERIGEDVRQVDGPLDADSAEQVVELEIDEVLDGIDSVTRVELEAFYKTLGRIERGEFGVCVKCEEEIPLKRLEVRSHSAHCVNCAAEEEG